MGIESRSRLYACAAGVDERDVGEARREGRVHGLHQRLELDRVLRCDLDVALVRVRVLELLELVGELLVVVLIAALRDGLLVFARDEVEALAVDDDDQLDDLLGRRLLAGLPLALLVRLEARQLRPDGGDEQERHHAGQKIDVRNQVQVGVDGLLAALATSLDSYRHGITSKFGSELESRFPERARRSERRGRGTLSGS